ncbi:MAG: exodeoxyribonuclease VII small subunit [Bacteroidales bacterium]|nr:exodeoxyribonuclease VII small subunit [Bacteroidales bacterium]
MENNYYSEEFLNSYDMCFAELEKIEKELENPNISVDQIAILASKYVPLVKACKQKLIETQDKVENTLKEIQNI